MTVKHAVRVYVSAPSARGPARVLATKKRVANAASSMSVPPPVGCGCELCSCSCRPSTGWLVPPGIAHTLGTFTSRTGQSIL